jgi:predicted transcriptional regulator
MVSAEEHFGVHAGKVWEALKANGPMTIGKMSEVLELEDHDIKGALGWLGREGKLDIEKQHNHFVFSLRDN